MSLEYVIAREQIAIDKERFTRRLERNTLHTSCGCVIWLGAADWDGYCRINFRHNGKHRHLMVHRLFYVLMSKESIPLNMEVDHVCKHRACVKHLQLVSGAFNKRLRNHRE